MWPSSGSVEVLDQTIGRVDARELRGKIGYASAALETAIDPQLTAREVVMTARHGALGPWWHAYTSADAARADALLADVGARTLADHAFGTLSTGEARRVQIARALMSSPDLLILDEPASGLDLGARETLVHDHARLAAARLPAAILLVTHHVEEIPAGFDYAIVLSAGGSVAAGPIEEVLTGPTLSAAFGLPIEVEGRDGRFRAWSNGVG